jgi:hypothetical protein
MTSKKEYIKNLIIRSFKGQVDQTEVQQVKAELVNYNREDLRDLKITVKELAQEAVDEQISKEFSLPSDWKELVRDFSHSCLNVYSAILDEEIIYQWILIEKQDGMDQQTKIIKILPVVSQSLDRIVARVPSKQVNKNWKADKSLTAKLNKVVKGIQGFYFRQWAGGLTEEELKQKIDKFVGILGSLTPEEIAVLKEKLKIFANNCFDKYAPPQIKNSPEIRQFINSTMNFLDVIYDDKLLKDCFNMIAKMVRLSVQDERIWKEKDPWVVIQKTGIEEELKTWIRNYTQYFNKLAGEGEKIPLSAEKEENIIQRLTQKSNLQLNQEGANLKDIHKNNLIFNGLNSSSSGLENLTEESLIREFKEVFLNTQIKPKWYQNPWIIWPLVGVVFIVGGLITWWLIGRKKEKKIDNRSNEWNNY